MPKFVSRTNHYVYEKYCPSYVCKPVCERFDSM